MSDYIWNGRWGCAFQPQDHVLFTNNQTFDTAASFHSEEITQNHNFMD